MYSLFAPLRSSFAGFSVTLMVILSSLYLAGNRVEFQVLFACTMSLAFITLIVQKNEALYHYLGCFWKWSILLYILLLIGIWRAHIFQGMLDAGIDQEKIIAWGLTQGTVAPMRHFLGVIYWIALYFLFIIAMVAACKRKFKQQFLFLFFVFTILLSLYGLFIFATGNETVLWFAKIAYFDDLTATFINRNSFAIFASCGFIVGVYLTQLDYKKFMYQKIHHSLSLRIANIIDYCLGAHIFYAVGLLIIMTAIILTHSRSGIVLTFVATLVFYFLNQKPQAKDTTRSRSRGRHRKSYKKYILLTVIALFIIIAPVIFYNFFDRLSYAIKDIIIRLEVYKIALQMIADRPFLGFGLGSFEYAFQHYRNDLIHRLFYWDKAHSTFLEMSVDIGVPAMICIFCGYGSIYLAMIRNYLHSRDSLMLVYLMIPMLLIVHSLIDFSLQMPAIAILFHVILASAYVHSFKKNNI
ncbi:MAG: O-antigen ligase [Dasania sp.]|jgi:O-antigen ligase